MKAITYTRYGPPDVLQLKEVEKPTPKEGEVLVEVRAVSLNAYDWRMLMADPFLVRLATGGFFKPAKTIPGADIAGRVVAAGPSAKQYRPGDEVYGDISAGNNGGCAEYVCAPEAALAPKPANLSFEQAAAVPMAALTALQGLRDVGKVKPGQKVLIYGASGGVGTFAVQLAKAFGAEVTAVCSTRNVDMVRSLGADHVIDYTKQDFAKSGERYDVILAANGGRSIFDYKRALNPQGIYVMAGGSGLQLFQALLLGPWLSKSDGQKLTHISAHPSQNDLKMISEFLQSGKVVPVIERCYPLSETADAIRYLHEGHARGKLVIVCQS